MSDKHDSTEPQEEELVVEDTSGGTDEPELEEVEAHSASKIKKLQALLKEKEEERRQAQEELQRTKADFLNARKRLEEDKERSLDRQKMKLLESLLPLCDSFTMAMSDKKVWENVDENWRKGVEGINAQLQSILKQHAVSIIDPTGADFDPNLHDAMGEVPVDDENAHHTVVSVVQNGYEIELNGTKQLLRPARVMVGTFNGTSS